MEYLSLVSKICTELDNHLGINDKDLAEFIIDLENKNRTYDTFRKALLDNGAEFPDSLVQNLQRIINLMRPSRPGGASQEKTVGDKKEDKKSQLLKMFPGLALPNDTYSKKEESDDDEKVKAKPEKHSETHKKTDMSDVDAAMMELEALAPGEGATLVRPHKEVSSRDRHKRRSRDRDTKRRSRSREDRHSDRRRSRSRDKERRRRSRSRDNRRRSRSREDRDRDRDRRHKSSSSRDHHERRRRSRSRSTERRDRRDRSRDCSEKMPPPSAAMTDDPEAGKIYSGKIANIVPFGCFVQLFGLRKRWEGLVHISQLRAEGRVTDVTEVVTRNQTVKVKVMSITGQKVSLLMKIGRAHV